MDLVTTSLDGPLCGRVGNWDDHAVNHHVFDAMKARCGYFDQAVSALIEDVHARGLDRRVLIVVTGEFGRTPRISYAKDSGSGVTQPGRDHWPRAVSLIFSGGGIAGGQVVGATDRLGADVTRRRVGVRDFLATIYHHLGSTRRPSRYRTGPAGRYPPSPTAGRSPNSSRERGVGHHSGLDSMRISWRPARSVDIERRTVGWFAVLGPSLVPGRPVRVGGRSRLLQRIGSESGSADGAASSTDRIGVFCRRGSCPPTGPTVADVIYGQGVSGPFLSHDGETMSEACLECGTSVPDGGSCRDHFHALLLLEAEIPGVSGSILHFYAVAAYGLQHPDRMKYTAEAFAGLHATLAAALDGLPIDGSAAGCNGMPSVPARHPAGGRSRGVLAPGRLVDDDRGRLHRGELGTYDTYEEYGDRVTAWARWVCETLAADRARENAGGD